MRIICCYSSDVNPLARQALELFAPETEYVETRGLSGYGEAIASRWDGSDDLVVIEQDKEITTDVIKAFSECSHVWCLFTYFNFPEPYVREAILGLGCTKFSAKIQQIVSPAEFLVRDLPWMECPDCNGRGCWRYLDSRISFAIMNHQIEPFTHGRVKHHHQYPPDWATKRGLD